MTFKVTETAAPNLDELLKSENPAWLWDGERVRIVWANVAGTSWFGAETLFDLLELRFDEDEASVAAIKDLSARLPRGERATVELGFAAASDTGALTCNCHIHTLADGRAGLLVCGTANARTADSLSNELQALMLGALPMPVCVVTGSGHVIFANDALRNTLLNHTAVEFANEMIKKSLVGGLISGLKTIKTKFGARDMQVIVRPLEKADRLADAKFMLILEDVTERRSLERSLLAAADDSQPAPDQATPETSQQQVEGDVERALSALRVEIENKTTTQTPKQDADHINKNDGESNLGVPNIVSDTLNNIPQAIVLVDDAGVLLFGNDSAVKLMEVENWPDIGNITTLGDALAALEGQDGAVSVFSAKDEALDLDVVLSKFPWQGGPVMQAKLSLESTGEEADNRRSPDGLKKNSELSPRPSPSAHLLASGDETITSPQVPENFEAAQDNPSQDSPSNDELRAILDTATDGIITLDSKGNICSFSAGAEALFGHHSAEVTDKSFGDLLAGDSRKVIADYLDALSGSGLAAVFNDGREVEAQVKQGGIISLFITIGRLQTTPAKPTVSDEGIAVFCVVVRDITQWKNTEAELRLSKEMAEESNDRKSMFLANISHELRTPLNAIMGFSEVMRSERFGEIENEKYLAYANDIHASGGHLLALINDLLDLTKVESGKLELDFTSVNLLNIIDDAMNSLREQATSNRILLRKAAASNLPNVVADVRSMTQILLNLLSNSVKFTQPGGQVIISVQLQDNGELHLSIKDTGRGMNKVQLQRALQPFQQIEGDEKTETATAMPGTGLGLPLTKALVEANRAKFTITSAPKKGTLVEIVFPTTRVLAE